MHVILSLPGIGSATARTLMTRFRSLHELLNADAAHLSTIPGISPTRNVALVQLLQAAFSPSDNGVGGET